jgi:cytochrome c peroxidase
MSKKVSVLFFSILFVLVSSAYKYPHGSFDRDSAYSSLYDKSISGLERKLNELYRVIYQSDLNSEAGRKAVYNEVYICRKALKKTDLWTRYFEPNAYRALNGPLPVEWETEVFEKFEKPYKRQGYGLTLIENSLDSGIKDKEVFKNLILPSIKVIEVYRADSVTKNLNTFDHFFLANRLFLLNLAAIYTTGFECPNNDSIIPELRAMINDVADINTA